MKEDREAFAALEGKHLGQMSRYYKTTEIWLQKNKNNNQQANKSSSAFTKS